MISESWGVYSLGHLVIPFSVLFKLLINWKEKERGKSQMSGVILLLVISSLLTYALLPSGPFPLLPSSSFAFLRCTLGITQPAATLLSSSCCCYCSRQKRYWGHFKFQKVLTAAAKQTKGEKKSLLLSYALRDTCIWCLFICFQSSMCNISHSNCHHLKQNSTQAKCSSKV